MMTGGTTGRAAGATLLIAAAAALSVIVVGCSEPLEFVDWVIPVSEETRIVEYGPVPIDERTEVIELVGELVIGQQSDDVDAMLFQPVGLAADNAGRIFVLDMGNNQVKAFAADGSHLANLGREGQGPGEFQFPRAITMSGDHVVASDLSRRRLMRWTTSGEFVGEIPVEFTRGLFPLVGQQDGSFVASFDARDDDWPLTYAFGAVTFEGGLATEFFDLRAQVPMYRQERGWQALDLPDTRPSIAATPHGEVYITRGDEYQILALDVDGGQRWALRVASAREPYDEEAIAEAIVELAEMFPEMRRDNVDIPSALPALDYIAVDGHGHLYVFPYAAERSPGAERAVDVYSADGERIFSGLIRADLTNFPAVNGSPIWRAAVGDLLYAFAVDTVTDEPVAVRYRLVKPFD